MWGESHRAIGKAIARLIHADDVLGSLLRGSVEPDGSDTRAHHAATDGGKNARYKIEQHVRSARDHILSGERVQAAYDLGVALHYLADYQISSGLNEEEHRRAEAELSLADFDAEFHAVAALGAADPQDEDPLAALRAFLALPVGGTWHHGLLWDTLVCCLATGRAIFMPLHSTHLWRQALMQAEEAEAALMRADSAIGLMLKRRFLDAETAGGSLKWWQLLSRVRLAARRKGIQRGETAYVKRRALKTHQERVQAALDAQLVTYGKWFLPLAEPPEIKLPERQWVRVGELAVQFGIHPRRAEVMLAGSGACEHERRHGRRWLRRDEERWARGFLGWRLECCRRAGAIEAAGGRCLLTCCGYCGETIRFGDPGMEYEAIVECPNEACVRTYKY